MSVPAIALLLRLALLAAATDLAPAQRAADPHASGTLGDLLREVGTVGDADATSLLLQGHGFRTAADLRLLDARSEEGVELMEKLRVSGISIGDRSKVRLLLQRDGPGTKCVCGSNEQADAADAKLVESAGHPDVDSRDQRQRRLQGRPSDDGLSTDTIAIVLSVLFGGLGYMVQAFTARRMERVAQEQATEQHFAEQARQREHEQMQAQILRTDAWLDECCHPVEVLLYAIISVQFEFVNGAVHTLESTEPDVVVEMVASVRAHNAYITVDSDGKVRSARSGQVHWEPRSADSLGLTETFDSYTQFGNSAAGFVVTNANAVRGLLKPYSSLFPRRILDVIRDEPQSMIANDYRRHVRVALVPILRRVANILTTIASKIELPPTDWLQGKFPILPWRTLPNYQFLGQWIAVTNAFEAIVTQWEDGAFDVVSPIFVLPLNGLILTVDWSRARGESIRRELIGMTAESQVNHQVWEKGFVRDGRDLQVDNDPTKV